MARNDPQMNLRVPVELKEKIEKAAFDNGRTITAEAVYRLEQSFQDTNQPNIQIPVDEIVEALAKRFNDSGLLNLSNEKK